MPPDIDGIGGRLISSEKPEHTMTALPVVTQLNNSTRERRPEHCGIDGTITQYINRHLRLIPAPSDNPNDPLNFPRWRKALAIISVCIFGAAAISMQQLIASLLPIFMFEYAGLDPHLLNQAGGFGSATGSMPPPDSNGTGPLTEMPQPSTSSNPLEALSNIPGAEPLSRVNLLTSIPMLLVGLSGYVLIPASVAFGRRVVIIFCSLLATICTVWAGVSTSLQSHLAARCLHAVGAGAIESLIPLIIQDMTFIHQRNTAISLIWASQGVISITLGIGSPYIVSRMNWRWLYHVYAVVTGVSFVMIVLFVPETRWHRSPESLHGESAHIYEPGYKIEGKPSIQTCYGLLQNGGARLKDGWTALIEIIATLFFPIVAYMIVLNAIFLGIGLGTSITAGTVLLAPPYNWQFDRMGLLVISGFVSSVFVLLVGGTLADWLVRRITKRKGGQREAEYNLWNFLFPIFCGIFGCLLFGAGGTYVYQLHWFANVFGMTVLVFAFLTINILASVVVIESYPRMAGPVLVNVASFRNVVGFGFTYGTPEWVAKLGYMRTFSIFAGVIALVALPLPLFFRYGKRLRISKRFTVKKASTSL